MNRAVSVSAVLMTVLLTAHCASDESGSKTPPVQPKAAAAVVPPDPGPMLEHATGPGEVVSLEPLVVEADAWARVDGHLYVRVPYPADLSTVILGRSEVARLIVDGPNYGLAVPASQGRLEDRPWFYVRFADGVDIESGFTVHWHQPANRQEEAGHRQRVDVRGVKSGPQNARLEQHFAEAASKWMEHRGHRGFGAFASARLKSMAGTRVKRDVGRVPQRARRTSLIETMALYSGLTSVEEALQSDRGLGLGQGMEASARTIPVTELTGVQLPKHPWEKMIADLAKGPTPKHPVVEPVASAVPAEMAYFVTSDLEAFGASLKALSPTFGTLMWAHNQQGSLGLQARYERQLMLRIEPLVSALGRDVVHSVAMVTSTPYLASGTDLSLLFHARDGGALEAALDAERDVARGGRPDAEERIVDLAGHRVRRTQTADRAIAQYRVRAGDYVLISNSAGAVAQILATLDGQHPALAKSGEFRYFRALYPYQPSEAGFLFLGDAFVGAVVGPRQKILQSRRMRAQAAIRSMGYAALLHGWLEGRAPKTAAELSRAGVLTPRDLRHADGADIQWTLAGGASSSWGTAAAVRPHMELSLEKVTPEEQGAYQRFANTYQTYWRGFIDPIGVQLTVTEGAVDLHARMLPILRRSDYRDIMALVGDTRLTLGGMSRGLRFVFGVAESSPLRRTLDQMGRALSGHRDVGLNWLGDWVMVGAGDRSGLWDAALAIGEVPSKKGTHQTRRADLRKSVLNRLPLYVAAHIRNRLALVAALAGLKVQASEVGTDLVSWGPTTPNGDVAVVKIEEKLSQREVEEPLSLFYAVVEDVFVMSLSRATLDAQIDAVRRGDVPRVAETRSEGPQATFAFRPAGPTGYLNRTMLGLLEHGAVGSHLGALSAYEVLARGLGRTAAHDPISDAQARAYLGYIPRSPHGGAYSVGEDGVIRHSLYGSTLAPTVLAIPVRDSAFTGAIEAIESLRMSLGFEGEGRDRSMVTHLHWAREP